jgi:hypothetical protein
MLHMQTSVADTKIIVVYKGLSWQQQVVAEGTGKVEGKVVFLDHNNLVDVTSVKGVLKLGLLRHISL